MLSALTTEAQRGVAATNPRPFPMRGAPRGGAVTRAEARRTTRPERYSPLLVIDVIDDVTRAFILVSRTFILVSRAFVLVSRAFGDVIKWSVEPHGSLTNGLKLSGLRPERWRLAGWPGARPAAGVTASVGSLAGWGARLAGETPALGKPPPPDRQDSTFAGNRRPEARRLRASRRDASAPNVNRLSSGH